ncbi:16S rRNA (guanine(527)-N(7))-methyltransferase RsmG [Roseovarius sp. EL26]|uniref:16S rRNA (guanine(527)-N(7))-methyltransferase RsmG n=1 Tax=Roseovarius sp. EL26 TaxID=2126672 RepID=UPI000EA12F02|nr:16S rRNA (guanine(527)-N(7))-methyltransferase RsmG [Roseovarius sp. EL26]
MSDLLQNVSRETQERLSIYLELLKKWNKKINLVSPATLKSAWQRHFVDSIQICQLSDKSGQKWVDMGSGAGFPGLVVSIVGMEDDTPHHVTLIESDMRKCMFLRTVIREVGAPAEVINDRIERISSLEADIVSARALADLKILMGYADHHLKPDGMALFLKGNNWKTELKDAETRWTFDYNAHNSLTENGSVIMNVSGIQHV